MSIALELEEIHAFLKVPTPEVWLERAPSHINILLIDHAHCEKKAASTALNLLYRYVDRPDLLQKMAQLAREELLHFEQVLELMKARGIAYQHLSPSRYAQGLRQHIRPEEPGRLIDTLIIGAFIEARSCERFAALADSGWLDNELTKYYRFLLKSESRHFLDYLSLAKLYSQDQNRGLEIYEARIHHFRGVENRLIEDEDTQFRFHSGVIQDVLDIEELALSQVSPGVA